MYFRLSLLIILLAQFTTPIYAEEPTADSAMRAGVRAFYDAKPAAAVAAFDQVIKLAPDAAPQLWQRGLALYYTENYKEGRKQFELHQTVNPNDVENAAWHFICVARAESVDAARKVLIPIEGDTRIPMKEVHALFAGKGTEQAVLQAAEKSADETELRNQRCYAHLYLGLYHEALGNTEKAKEHMVQAATTFSMEHYMGKTAQVHVKVRGWGK